MISSETILMIAVVFVAGGVACVFGYLLAGVSLPGAEEARAIWTIYRIRRQQRRWLAEQVKARGGIKAPITEIGTVERVPGEPDTINLVGWTFDLSTGAIVQRFGKDGRFYFCGYTKKELLEIHASRDEFVDRPR